MKWILRVCWILLLLPGGFCLYRCYEIYLDYKSSTTFADFDIVAILLGFVFVMMLYLLGTFRYVYLSPNDEFEKAEEVILDNFKVRESNVRPVRKVKRPKYVKK